MMKRLVISVVAMVCILSACGTHTVPTEEVIAPEVEEQTIAIYDTNCVDAWCMNARGTVRMIGGCIYSIEDNVITLEDDTGNLWDVIDEEISDDGNLMLWIADNNTPNDVEDDIVVKVWTEACDLQD